LPEVPGAVDPETTACVTPPRPIIACKSSDGTQKNQTCSDEGPLTLERSKTVDEEISGRVIDFLDRNDPRKTGKPFFVWYNPARMHVTTMLSDKYLAMLGEKGGNDRLAVNDELTEPILQRRLDDPRISVSPVAAAPRDQANAIALASREQALTNTARLAFG